MVVEMVRSPNLSQREIDERLYRVYSIILSMTDDDETASGEATVGRPDPSLAASDTPDPQGPSVQ